jgi:16S rRNA (cytosine1402-N4)-methyltransferase
MVKIEHLPVFVNEAVAYLNCSGNKIIVDCTVGEGGHAESILGRLGPSGIFLGIDRDQDALVASKERLRSFKQRSYLIWDNFTNLKGALKKTGIDQVDGILFDLGVSSLQLNRAARGFSFLREGPLDMRMDHTRKPSAIDLVNKASFKELSHIIHEFGEERWAKRITRAILKERTKALLATTGQLAEIVARAVPGRGRIHPATRTFQALRIKVNRELENLQETLPQAVDILRAGGRICVISYHSLEDRIVKHFFKDCARRGSLNILTKKPLTPRREELTINPRARSAKLRAVERI